MLRRADTYQETDMRLEPLARPALCVRLRRCALALGLLGFSLALATPVVGAVYPSDPINPTSYAECDALRQRYLSIYNELSGKASQLWGEGIMVQGTSGYTAAMPYYMQSNRLHDEASAVHSAGMAAAGRCRAIVSANQREEQERKRAEQEQNRISRDILLERFGITPDPHHGDKLSTKLLNYNSASSLLSATRLNVGGFSPWQKTRIQTSLRSIQELQWATLTRFEDALAGVEGLSDSMLNRSPSHLSSSTTLEELMRQASREQANRLDGETASDPLAEGTSRQPDLVIQLRHATDQVRQQLSERASRAETEQRKIVAEQRVHKPPTQQTRRPQQTSNPSCSQRWQQIKDPVWDVYSSIGGATVSRSVAQQVTEYCAKCPGASGFPCQNGRSLLNSSQIRD